MPITISVITPTLNAERYLPECLASLRTASRGLAVEHLVIDGGSTDETEALVRAAGARWVSIPGLKQSGAINRGFELARGQVVAWLNADDLYFPGALDKAAGQFADPHVDVLLGDCEVIGPDGRHLWWMRPGPYDFKRLLRRGNYLPQPAVFLRRDFIQHLGGLDESFEYAMDFELWLRLGGARVRYLPVPLAQFRWHRTSKTGGGQLAGWRENLRAIQRHGGGWTPELAWSYLRCRLSVARQRFMQSAIDPT